MPSYHTTFFFYYSIATSEGRGDLNPVSPNKGEQVMSTEQQGSCVTIQLLNQRGGEENAGGGGGANVFSFQSISNIGQSHNRGFKNFPAPKVRETLSSTDLGPHFSKNDFSPSKELQ